MSISNKQKGLVLSKKLAFKTCLMGALGLGQCLGLIQAQAQSSNQMTSKQPKDCEAQWYGHWTQNLGQKGASCECRIEDIVYHVKSEAKLTRENVAGVCSTLCESVAVPTPQGECTIHSMAQHSRQTPSYPLTKKGSVIDELHGQKIADPYRWLEDDLSKETESWVERQNQMTKGYLKQLPKQKQFKEAIEGVWNYAKMSSPILIGNAETGRLFYTYNQGLENQSKLYTRLVKQSHAQAKVVIDPNQLSKDGTAALKLFKPSKNGHYVAYQVAFSGSDWVEVKIRDVRSGKDLNDHLKWIKFSGLAWDKAGQGFYYSRYAEPKGSELSGVNTHQMLYYHRLGDDQTKDQLVYARADHKDWGFDGDVSEDGRLLIITVWQGASDKNQIFYKRLDQANAPVIPLLTGFDHSYGFLGNQGDQIFLQSDRDAPKGHIISVKLNQHDPSQYQVVVPEQKEALTRAQMVSNRLVLHYLKDATSQVKFHTLYGEAQGELALPPGTIGRFSGGVESQVSYFSYTSFTTPTMVYRFDHFSHQTQVFFEPKLSIDPQQFKTEQVFVKSKDGTKVPAFLIYAQQSKEPQHAEVKNAPKPTVLYGYGGFNISLSPYFKPDLLPWLQQGGMYVVANLRGGGEYGETWHKAGMREQKQNVFDDFIAVAEWLIDSKKTRADLLGIYGGSNGGLLVGACSQQRPDLFAAAVPAVGVLDMLRFHKFTIGWAWIPEYGDPDQIEDFKFLQAYSPLHNLKNGQRAPATLVLTADHDDRVVPAHSFKYISKLQDTHQGGGPTLIRIDQKAGHGAGKPTSKKIESAADLWAFFAHHLKL